MQHSVIIACHASEPSSPSAHFSNAASTYDSTRGRALPRAKLLQYSSTSVYTHTTAVAWLVLVLLNFKLVSLSERYGVPRYLCTTGYFKTDIFSIFYREMLFDCSKLLKHTILVRSSGARAHCEFATFDVGSYGSKHLEQNFFFYCFNLDTIADSSRRTGYFKRGSMLSQWTLSSAVLDKFFLQNDSN